MLGLCAIVIALVAFILWQRRHLYRLSWLLPGPIGLPIIGNGIEIADVRSK